MNDILSNLDRRSDSFIEWLKFEKDRIPIPNNMNDFADYSCRVWAYENILQAIRRFPEMRIGRLIENVISTYDSKACNNTNTNINLYSIVKDEAEWIKDQIISLGGWI